MLYLKSLNIKEGAETKRTIFGKEPGRIFKITNYSLTGVIFDRINRLKLENEMMNLKTD